MQTKDLALKKVKSVVKIIVKRLNVAYNTLFKTNT